MKENKNIKTPEMQPKVKTTANTRYNVINGSETYTGLTSPFDAIAKAYRCNGSAVESDTGTVIFESGTSKYYVFQFTNFYGTVNTAADAEAWVSNYDYAHAVYGGTGTFEFDTATSMKGGFERVERNNNGYFYNFSQDEWGYKSVQTTVSLTQSSLAFPPYKTENGKRRRRLDNAYVFLAAIYENEVIEAGIIMSGRYGQDSRKWSAYTKLYSNGEQDWQTLDEVANITENADKTFSTDRDIVIKLSLRADGQKGAYCRFEDTNGNLLCDYTWSAAHIQTGKNVQFLSAVSLVPDLGGEAEASGDKAYKMGDIRDGAHFKNVILKSYIYDEVNQGGQKHSYTATNDTAKYSYIYDTDTIDWARFGPNDIINIYYDKEYMS